MCLWTLSVFSLSASLSPSDDKTTLPYKFSFIDFRLRGWPSPYNPSKTTRELLHQQDQAASGTVQPPRGTRRAPLPSTRGGHEKGGALPAAARSAPSSHSFSSIPPAPRAPHQEAPGAQPSPAPQSGGHQPRASSPAPPARPAQPRLRAPLSAPRAGRGAHSACPTARSWRRRQQQREQEANGSGAERRQRPRPPETRSPCASPPAGRRPAAEEAEPGSRRGRFGAVSGCFGAAAVSAEVAPAGAAGGAGGPGNGRAECWSAT